MILCVQYFVNPHHTNNNQVLQSFFYCPSWEVKFQMIPSYADGLVKVLLVSIFPRHCRLKVVHLFLDETCYFSSEHPERHVII